MCSAAVPSNCSDLSDVEVQFLGKDTYDVVPPFNKSRFAMPLLLNNNSERSQEGGKIGGRKNSRDVVKTRNKLLMQKLTNALCVFFQL